ncbi:PEP-CTERM sorting domain-containing protein [Desulfobacter sp.]
MKKKYNLIDLKAMLSGMRLALLSFYLICLVVVVAASPGRSLATTIEYDDTGPIWYTQNVYDVGTDGYEMAGMAVTVTDANGDTQTSNWIGTVPPKEVPQEEGSDTPGSGEASGDGWRLSVTEGSTYPNPNSSKYKPWVFTLSKGLSISSIFIDAGAGGTVFDVIPPNSGPSTPNSQSGSAFAFYSDSMGIDDTTATYSGMVALSGQAPIGDLYRFLSIDFKNPLTSGETEMEIMFSTDTDTVSSITTPEPSAMIFFAMGMLSLAWFFRKNI